MTVRKLLRGLFGADLEEVRWREALRRLVGGLRPDSLLDVGCGDGAWAAELARELGVPEERVHGIEVHPVHAGQAETRLRLARVDLESQAWPYEPGSFSLVCVNQVLEHLKNVHVCLAEAERVLKVGGHLAVGVPNLAGLMNRLRLAAGRQPMCLEFPGPHVRGFSHGALLRFLAGNPAFRVLRTRGSSLYPVPWPLTELLAAPLPSLSAYSFILLEKTGAATRSAWLDATSGVSATTFLKP